MINYRTYVDIGKGYECLGTHNAKRTIKLIDDFMKVEHKNKRILVIECNHDDNYEFPIFIYTGYNEQDYHDFKEKFIEEHDCKCFRKKY